MARVRRIPVWLGAVAAAGLFIAALDPHLPLLELPRVAWLAPLFMLASWTLVDSVISGSAKESREMLSTLAVAITAVAWLAAVAWLITVPPNGMGLPILGAALYMAPLGLVLGLIGAGFWAHRRRKNRLLREEFTEPPPRADAEPLSRRSP